MTWIYWTLGTLGYLLVAVVFGAAVYASGKKEGVLNPHPESVVAGLAWPLAMPFALIGWSIRELGRRLAECE